MTEAEKWRELCRFWRERTLALESDLSRRVDDLKVIVVTALADFNAPRPSLWARARARFARTPAPAPFDASEIGS